jgi:hypothetical protein
MKAAAPRPDTSYAGLVETPAEQRPKPRPPLPLRTAAASSPLSSGRLPMWAARIMFLLGLLNIASAAVRKSPRLVDWSQGYCRP